VRGRSRRWLAVALALPLLAAAGPRPAEGWRAAERAQQQPPQQQQQSQRFPFGVGERLDFEARFGGVRVGNAFMEVYGFEQLRGRDAYHTMFRISGGTLFFKVDSRFDSWVDAASFSSLRFRQDQNEGGRDRERQYEIFPERATYRDEQGQEFASVSDPLDDGSFLYFVRATPLEVGREYEYNRYFKPDRNPVRIRVLRRERVKVPAGEFAAVVVQPIIKAKGLFSEGGHAEVWISDDPQRRILQIRTRFAGLRLSLHLTAYRPPVSGGPNVSGAASAPRSTR
jgi:hypothetical protein